ncbi:PRELI domain-containing protein 2 [Strongylocentrotus purpuratus]|uniref:PRELI/MSF1 domain-containing protein n=1 Tax=Strongylocentrotus purpuratus TaxID=7668 RepID=A0A7M7TGY1_STRPU|nr:PRELI domain-containing protein 2 [Strongylocentrotus purpuratus]|eukprot:XP_792603.4 PREDICTED: PRELI domain-containing protein 2 [Strongylocentrotus purpuratus]
MVFEVVLDHVYKFPLDLVINTHLTKYPNKKLDVLEVRLEEYRHDPKDDVEYWKRVMVCRNIMPSILKMIPVFNKAAILLEEECWYDHKQETLKIKSRNVTWYEYAQAWEESQLQRSKDSRHWTVMSQRGGMDVKVFGALGHVAELFLHGAAKRNGMRAIKNMEDLMIARSGAKDTGNLPATS